MNHTELSSDTYQLLVEQANDGVAILQDEIIKYANPAVFRIFGYAPGALEEKPFADFLHPEDAAGLLERYRRRMAGEAVPSCYETRVRSAEGNYIPVEINAAIFSFQGRPANLISLRDVTERKHSENALRAAREKIEQLHDAAYRFAECDTPDRVYVEAIRAAEEILEFSRCSLDIVEGDRLVVKATSSGLAPVVSRDFHLTEGGIATETYQTGKAILFGEVADFPSAQPTHESIRSGISLPFGAFGVFQVVSTTANAFNEEDVQLLELLVRHAAEALERVRLHQELEEQATHDPLTGVFNRRHFTAHIEKELERSRRYEHPLAFVMMDINGFKAVNDAHGHQTGDAVLCGVAHALQEELRSVDMIVRYGGDEFLAVLPETNGEADLISTRLQQSIAERGNRGEFSGLPITIAAGMAYWSPRIGNTVQEVLRIADDRMYEAKRAFRQEQRAGADPP